MAARCSGHKSQLGVSLMDSNITIQEKMKICLRPRYRPRKVNNKGAILVLIWNFLAMSLYHLIISYDYTTDGRLWQLVIGIILPLAGWLADTYTGRYKMIGCSLWIMWLATMFACVSSIVAQLVDAFYDINPKVITCLLLVGTVGIGGFQANIIQFGIDQLHDASTEEIKSFIVWYIWTIFSSGIVHPFVFSCLSQQYKILQVFFCCVNISIALVILFCYKDCNCLVKEPIVRSPFKLVYNVIKYAIKNKYPARRSAFTYCEDSYISRMDLGKAKYGGPFKTEQVEDVKTFLRLIPVVIFGGALAGMYFSVDQVKHYMLKLLTVFAERGSVRLNYSLTECYAEDSFVYTLTVNVTLLIIVHELFIYPIFQRCYPISSSLNKLFVGTFLQILTVTILMIFEVTSRYNFMKNFGYNVTVECVFYEHPGVLSTSFDYRWSLMLDVVESFSMLSFFVGALEFLCAQVPFQMKGMMLGVAYGSIFIFSIMGGIVMMAFRKKLSIWGTGVISCGFWFILLLLFVDLFICFIQLLLFRCYKRRKRDDLLPSEHYFAEKFYSKELDSDG